MSLTRVISTAVFSAAVALSVQSFAISTSQNNSFVKSFSKETSEIIKRVSPAVVSVRIEIPWQKAQELSAKNGLEDFVDPFQDEMWRHFFDMPQKETPPQQQPLIAIGSGYLISADGLVVTNNHVVAYAETITVTNRDGKEFSAKLLGADPNTDIALLKIEGQAFPFLTFANSDLLEVGEWIIVMGDPFGLRASATSGMVSAKGRRDLDISTVEEYFQTDAAVNHGNSGGPVINYDGQVVGMSTAIISTSANGGNHGVAFAIPSNLIQRITGELLKNGKVVRGYLGVTLQSIENDIAPAFGLTKMQGVLVTDVAKSSPAEAAGLKSGDIILRVNDIVMESQGALRNYIALHPNEKVKLQIFRDSKQIELTATIGVFSETEKQVQSESQFGLQVEDLTPEVAQQWGYNSSQGVIIKYVDPNSSAYRAGLRRGQVILSINRIPIQTKDDFYKILLATPTKGQVLVHVKDKHATRFLVIKG